MIETWKGSKKQTIKWNIGTRTLEIVKTHAPAVPLLKTSQVVNFEMTVQKDSLVGAISQDSEKLGDDRLQG